MADEDTLQDDTETEDQPQSRAESLTLPTAPLDRVAPPVGGNPPSVPPVVPQKQPTDTWAEAFPKGQADPWDNAFPDQVKLNGRTLEQSLDDDRRRFSFGQVGSAFVHGWNGVAIVPPEKWTLGPESEAQLKGLFTYPEIDKVQQSRWQAFNNAFLYPAVRTLANVATIQENAAIKAVQTPLQLGGALFGTAGSTIEQSVAQFLGPQAGREAAALATEFLPMHTTGMPHVPEGAPRGFVPPEAEPFVRPGAGEVTGPEGTPVTAPPVTPEVVPTTPITPDFIAAARHEGVIGSEAEWDGTSVYSAARSEDQVTTSLDIHGVARQIDPETFEQYDRLRAVHDLALQEFRDEAERARAEVEGSPNAHGERLSDIGAELDNLQNVPNDRYVYRRRQQLLREQEQLRDERDQYLENAPDLTEMVLRSPENLQLRNFIADNARQMLALEPRVRDVYVEAAQRTGQVEEAEARPSEPAQPEAAGAATQPAPADFLVERRGLEGPVQFTVGETTTTQHGISGDVVLHRALGIAGGESAGVSPSVWGQAVAHAKSIGRDDVADAIQRRWETERTSAGISDQLRADGDRLIGRPKEQAGPGLDIATHAADQFKAAGRPEQESSDLGALADAYYKAKADLFQGAKGSAEDLYRAEFPSVVGRAQGPRGASGMLQRGGGRSILTLFAKADPSTAIHELGHNWTLDLLRDAKDPAAPIGLVQDASTVRSWLNVPEGSDLTVRQQERMARAFETYMRTSTAPSARLAAVFDRFRDWMNTVYSTLRNRGVAINDDIKGVFDRWFAGEGEQRSVVAEEQEGPPRKPRSVGEIMAEDRVRESVARQTQANELIAYSDWQAQNRNAGSNATPAPVAPTEPGARPRTPRSLAQIMAEDKVSPAEAGRRQTDEFQALADWQSQQRAAGQAAAPGREPGSVPPQEAERLAKEMLAPHEPEAAPQAPEQAAEVAPEPVVAKNFGPEAKPKPPAPDRSRPYMRVPKEPQRLLEFMKEGVTNENGVRLFGRVKDPGGDLAAALGDRSLIRKLIDNQNGEGLDDFARRAADAGYFNGIEPETDAGVIDRIVADAEGHGQYSMHDEESVQAYQTAAAHNREVTRLASEHDIDPKGMTRQGFFKAIEDKVGREQFDAQEAMERARAIDAANEMRDDLQDWEGNEDERANSIDESEFERLWGEANASQELVGGEPGGEQPGVPGRDAGQGQEGAGHGGGGPGNAGSTEGQATPESAAAGTPTGPGTERQQPAGLTRAVEPSGGLAADLKRRTEELPKIGNIRLEYIDEGRYDDVLREVAGELSLSGDPRLRQGAERIAAVNAIMNEAARQHLDAIAKFQETPTPDNMVALEQARLRNAVAFENRSIAATDWAYTGHAQAKLIRESKRIISEIQAAGGEDELKLFQRQYEQGLDTQMQSVDQMGKRARDGLLSRYDKIERGLMSTFINGLLSNPVTHGGYLIGTNIWNMVRGGFIPVEAAAGVAREALTGQTMDRVLFGEMPAHFTGMAQGAMKAVVPAYRAFRTGEMTLEGSGAGAVPMDRQILPTLLGGKIGAVLETPTRVIRAIHVFNYSTAYTAEMYRAAYRDAARATGDAPATYTEFGARMQQFLNNPSDAAVEYAHDQAIRSTLMKPPARGSMQSYVSQMISKYPVLRVVAPFPQIGMNLAEEGLIRTTPLGVLSSTVRADIAAGGARADRALGSMVAGSSIALGASVAAVNGVLTGPGPDMSTADGRARMRVLTDQGWAPFAFRWGNTYLPYRKALGPLGELIGLAAAGGDAVHALSAGQSEEAFSRAKVGLREAVLDETWFRGVHDLFEAMDDWKTQGARYIQNLAASAVPFSGLQSGIRTQMDPYKRQAQTIGETIQSHVPGLSENLHPQIGPNGQPVLLHSTMGPHAVQNDPVDQRRIDLGMGVAPWPRELKGVALSEDQQERFARLSGTLSHQMLLPLVTSQGFSGLPRGLQMMQISRIESMARQRAGLIVQAESGGDLIQKQMQLKLRTRMEGRGAAPP